MLVNNGHEVIVETKAGEGSKYSDSDFSEAGAQIALKKKEVYKAPILIKSAPVMEEDLQFLHLNQTIISPIHLSMLKKESLEKMMEKRITALGFENLKDDSGTYPIVRCMSEIAGSAFERCILRRVDKDRFIHTEFFEFLREFLGFTLGRHIVDDEELSVPFTRRGKIGERGVSTP